MKGKGSPKAATIEARREDGVIRKTLKEPAGSYWYWKRLRTCFVRVNTTVYLPPSPRRCQNGKRQRKRKRAWLSPAQAALIVDEPELASLVESIGDRILEAAGTQCDVCNGS